MMIRKRPLLLLFLGIGMVVLGLFRQEAVVVLRKAIHICLECIGLA